MSATQDASKKIPSPCRSICSMDARGLCVGCYRTLEEIANWAALEPRQKQDVLVSCEKRRLSAQEGKLN